jgi:hypothetical protein
MFKPAAATITSYDIWWVTPEIFTQFSIWENNIDRTSKLPIAAIKITYCTDQKQQELLAANRSKSSGAQINHLQINT